jgi:hypothetical protein
LEGLLAAMANTQIKHSLEIIRVWNCGVSEKHVREMVDRHGFTNIKMINAGVDDDSDSESEDDS